MVGRVDVPRSGPASNASATAAAGPAEVQPSGTEHSLEVSARILFTVQA
jgi:hypothetical protein